MNLKEAADYLTFLAKSIPDADLVIKFGTERYAVGNIEVSHDELYDGSEYIQIALRAGQEKSAIPLKVNDENE